MKELIKLNYEDIKTGNNGGLMMFCGETCSFMLFF